MSERSDSMADAIEKHADLILRASGSGLRHYTMQKTRAAILMAVADCFEEAYRAGAEFGREHEARRIRDRAKIKAMRQRKVIYE